MKNEKCVEYISCHINEKCVEYISCVDIDEKCVEYISCHINESIYDVLNIYHMMKNVLYISC